MVDQAWALSDEQRAETVTRITQSIANLAFSQGRSIDDAESQEKATQVEKKAYTVAQVESRTTNGVRPHSDSLKAYTRFSLLNRFLAPTNLPPLDACHMSRGAHTKHEF